MKQREETSSPRGDCGASQDLFQCQTTLALTSTIPHVEDVSGDVLGQPWEETVRLSR